MASISTLLFRYQERPNRRGPADHDREKFDWWVVGGRWDGWARAVRQEMTHQSLPRSVGRRIPRFVSGNAVWSDELAHLRLSKLRHRSWPVAVITPYGDWIECDNRALYSGKPNVRERRARVAWFNTMRRLMRTWSGCLAVAIDYHFY
jgi:hypothetical protein